MSFKILSLDGGGMQGIISARILQEVERLPFLLIAIPIRGIDGT